MPSATVIFPISKTKTPNKFIFIQWWNYQGSSHSKGDSEEQSTVTDEKETQMDKKGNYQYLDRFNFPYFSKIHSFLRKPLVLN